jgi:hypothetical protein
MKNSPNRSDKPTVFWLGLLACYVALSANTAWSQKAKPKQKVIKISKDTTRVLGPLDEEGYVDFGGAIEQMKSKGVTRDNNGAIPFWQAVGSGPISPEHRARFFKVIGMEVPPEAGIPVSWGEYARKELSLPQEIAEATDELLVNARERPWKRGEFPRIATWLDEQEDRFKLIAVAARKERFFQPLLLMPDEPLVNAELPHAMLGREFTRGLQARAMLHVGEGRFEAALDDIETIRRLARHIGAGSTMLENLIGGVMESMACQGYVAVVQHQRPAPQAAAKLLAWFDKMGPMPKLCDSLDVGERFIFLQTAQDMARLGPGGA